MEAEDADNDFSKEALHRRATAVFATVVMLRRGLPRKLTPDLFRRGLDFTENISKSGLGKNKLMFDALCAASDRKLGICVYVSLNQCETPEKLQTLESLGSQISFLTHEQLAQMPRDRNTQPQPFSEPFMMQLPKVWLRLEVLLTCIDDSSVCEFYVLDPRVCCADCGKCTATRRKCSGCKAVYYCDAKCQLHHWGKHKTICMK